MRPSLPASLSIVALLALGGLLVVLVASGRRRAEGSAVEPARRTAQTAPATGDLAQPQAVDLRATLDDSPAASSLRCVRRNDGTPVRGISIHVEGVVIAGPSGPDGLLQVVREGRQPLTVWGEGWRPVFVRAVDELPTTVELDAADATLDVKVFNLEPYEEIVRSLVQPHAFPVVGDAPWEPVLRPLSFDRLTAEGLPPGEYDVYVWIRRRGAEPRPLSARGVSLGAGRTALVRLDAATPPPQEPDR